MYLSDFTSSVSDKERRRSVGPYAAMFRIQSQLIRIHINVFHNRYLKNTVILLSKTSNKDVKAPGEHPAFKKEKCINFLFWRHFGFPEF